MSTNPSTHPNLTTPVQPIEFDGDRARFAQNPIVRFLLEKFGGIGELSDAIGQDETIPREAWHQLFQLIGYSVIGFAEAFNGFTEESENVRLDRDVVAQIDLLVKAAERRVSMTDKERRRVGRIIVLNDGGQLLGDVIRRNEEWEIAAFEPVSPTEVTHTRGGIESTLREAVDEIMVNIEEMREAVVEEEAAPQYPPQTREEWSLDATQGLESDSKPMTLEEFALAVRDNHFTDDDGYGLLGTKDGHSGALILGLGNVRDDFEERATAGGYTHVYWVNK